MNILQLTSVCVCIAALILMLKNMKGEMGQLLSIAATVVVMAVILPYISVIISAMRELSELGNLGEKYLSPIIKITGIAYISQIGSELCSDSGEKALAKRVESAGKIAITVIALPIAKEAFIKIMGILT